MIVGRAIWSVTSRQVRYVTPVPPAQARELVAKVYAQVAAEMRIVVPPILLHSPAPPVLAASWMLMREPVLAGAATSRLAREAVAVAVSVANACPYCVDVHSTGMYRLGTERDAEAVVADELASVDDPGVRDVASWARVAHRPDDQAFRQLAAGPAERAELVGVAVYFHYLNRMVNIFLSDFLPPRLGGSARRRVKQGLSRILGATMVHSAKPGRSLALLPEAPPAAGTGWASGNTNVATAVARASAAFEAAGERALPPTVRELVTRQLADWRGEDAGLGRAWCDHLVAQLPAADRPAGRLALLAAIASYQIDQGIVDDFRRARPGDTALVEAAAWASYAAARQVGSWHVPTPVEH